ncbi:MAG: ferredoxin-NADP reductase [Bradymonadia bacterium]|jgi:ferredoxin-NADP reductase
MLGILLAERCFFHQLVELLFHHVMEVAMFNALLPRSAKFFLRSTAHNIRQSARALARQPRPVFQALHTPEELRALAQAARQPAAADQLATLALPVLAVEPDANGVRLYLERPPAFEFKPGQFLTLALTADGVEHRRQYSIFTPPAERERIGLAIRRVEGGVVSNHLVDTARAGDTVTADGPSGRFTLNADDSDALVLIAGGVGITPLLAIAKAAAAADRDVRLLYANRGLRSTMLADEVENLAALPNVTVTHILERKAKSRSSEVGRLDTPMLEKLLPPNGSEDFFICGPAPMMDTVTDYLRARGVPSARVHTERFAQARSEQRGGTGQRDETERETSSRTHAVRFAKSGRLVNIPEGQTLLEGARAAGIFLPFSCTMGGCAACKVRCDGDVHLPDPNCLTSDEAAAGETLACIACPRSALTIDA